MNLVLDFTDPLASHADLTGGKGANLAFLASRDFPVPPGFVVTAPAYREFAQVAATALARVTDFHLDDPIVLGEQAAELRRELEAIPLPAALVAEVRAHLAAHPADQAFSVRSSSTFEDLASAAFAGQHDTFLNVIGEAAILDRLRACFASLWQERAIAYRQRQGFDHGEAAMAVVIQRMVRCRVAGVGFTINPISGALDEMLVNANFGLGESVVSGDGEIDQFVLTKDGALKQQSIGHKTSRIVCGEAGTKELHIAPAEAELPSLTVGELTALTELMRRVETAYQFPQDIEWGMTEADLHLLQSRPVTTIPPRWTRDEAAERFPNVITPLAWDMVEEGFHKSLNHSFRLMGYPPFSGKWFGVHGHYIYGNQNAVEIYGGRMPLQIRSVADLEAALPEIRDRYAWVADLPLEWSRELDRYLLGLGEFLAEPLAEKDLAGVWDFVQRVNRLGTEYFLPNIAISLTQRALYKLLLGMLSLLAGDKAEGAKLFDALLCHCETKTGIINRELVALAASIRGDHRLAQLIAETPSRQLVAERRLAPFPAFAERFEKFLKDHGHRETDFDPYQPTWAEAPWVVLDNLRLMAAMPAETDSAGKERELRRRQMETEAALLPRVPESLRFFFHEVIRLARAYTTLDDVEHYQTTRLTLPLRKGLKELGHRLKRLGVVEEPMDVFFAHLDELNEAVACNAPEEWDKLAEAIRAEKAAYLAHRDAAPAWTLGEATTGPILEGSLTGLPGSPGVAEGPVYRVLSPDDFAGFPKGAVLVARTTNPAWTPLFYSACAVVTESGGPLSHGAVTAREMGIPAVMSVHGVLSALANGDVVRVDGGGGLVVRSGD